MTRHISIRLCCLVILLFTIRQGLDAAVRILLCIECDIKDQYTSLAVYRRLLCRDFNRNPITTN